MDVEGIRQPPNVIYGHWIGQGSFNQGTQPGWYDWAKQEHRAVRGTLAARRLKYLAKEDPAVVHSPKQKLVGACGSETSDVGSQVTGWLTINDYGRARRTLYDGADQSRSRCVRRARRYNHNIPRVLDEVQSREDFLLRINHMYARATMKGVPDACGLLCSAARDGHGERAFGARRQE
jgi:hypothetical protein